MENLLVMLLIEDQPTVRLWRSRPRQPAGVRVFAKDPELLAGVDAKTAARLTAVAVAPRLVLPPGEWCPPHLGDDAIGLLVLSGHLTLQLTVDGRCCPQLLGPGDLLRPEDQRDPGAVLLCEPAWRVVEQADVAVLDGRFNKLLGGHPSAVSALLGRAMRRSRHLAFHLAIAHVPRAEHRMHLLLWHLADRWGHVRTNGVHVPICLTHRLLADLACMQRPTATNALNGLIAAGHASRCRDGSWLLHGEPPAC